VCALPAAAVIGESLLAYALAWGFLEKFGGDSMREVSRNFEGYIQSLAASEIRI
jgi:chorismate synthase